MRGPQGIDAPTCLAGLPPFPLPPAAPSTPPCIVVGLGNEIAGDDGVGIEVARRLADELRGHATVEVVALPWAGFALLDVLRGRQRAAIVDCLVTGRHPPGTVVVMGESEFGGSVRLNSFHDVDFATVMALGRRMGWAMPDEVAIWGIEGGQVGEFRDRLTPAVAAAAEAVAREVVAFVGSTARRPEARGVLS